MMRDVLDSVTGQPGVRVAAIFSCDGLPLCILEADAATGITHRVAWNQGILKVFKRLLK